MSASHGWWAMECSIPGHPGPSLCFDPHLPGWPQLFRTRRECRAWIEKHHGYLKALGVRPPRAVMVSIVKANPDRTWKPE